MEDCGRPSQPGSRKALLFVPLLAVLGLEASGVSNAAVGTTYTVDTVDGTWDTVCGGTDCSLADGIGAANANPGKDTIVFNIPGVAPHVIVLPPIGSSLPHISDAVVIDGTTQAGYAGMPLVEVVGNGTTVIKIFHAHGGATAGTEIRGLAINNGALQFDNPGSNVVESNFLGTDTTGLVAKGPTWVDIKHGASGDGLTSAGSTVADNLISAGWVLLDEASDNEVRGNLIGTDRTGKIPLFSGSGDGITVVGDRNVLSGNVIAAMGGVGISISGSANDASADNRVDGNFVGTDIDGELDLGNGRGGIDLSGNADNNLVSENVISGNGRTGLSLGNLSLSAGNVAWANLIGTNGSGAAALGNDGNGIVVGAGIGHVIAGNVVSGNGGNGIHTSTTTTLEVRIEGNRIGTNAAGTTTIPNGLDGVATSSGVGASLTVSVGGRSADQRNIISGNGGNGISVGGSSAARVDILSNYIGTDNVGGEVLGNTLDGIEISGEGVTVGQPEAGNLISGNGGAGIDVRARDTRIQANFIGTTASGALGLGNGSAGVLGSAGAGAWQVGGTGVGEGNVIAGNGEDGVSVLSGTGNSVLGNSIYSNTGLGIDLNPDGVTANEPGDGDTGPNLHQNFPVITRADGSTIEGTLSSAANMAYTVELFANVACDLSGNGEGETFLARTTMLTNGVGSASFTVQLPTPVGPGTVVTATATDVNGNTSEFSQCRRVPERGRIIVEKVTLPDGDPQLFTFATSYGAAGFSLSDGQSNDSGLIDSGVYSVAEAALEGWDWAAACSDGSPPGAIQLGVNETVICTYTNTKRAEVTVAKTVLGRPLNAPETFDFQVRTGASAGEIGTVIGVGTATAGNGGQVTIKVVNDPTKDLLVVPGPYQFCEFILPGWSNPLGSTAFVPGIANDSTIDNSYQCVNVTLSAGETRTFTLDNRPPPGGQAKTIGFWKNWASCSLSSGKQKPILDRTLALGDVTVGTLSLHDSNPDPNVASDCQPATRLLNKGRVDNGKKMSSDPAFSFGAQYFAYRLNIASGANSTCTPANDAATGGQAILVAVAFNGSTHGNISRQQAAQLNAAAATLDMYNNDTLTC